MSESQSKHHKETQNYQKEMQTNEEPTQHDAGQRETNTNNQKETQTNMKRS